MNVLCSNMLALPLHSAYAHVLKVYFLLPANFSFLDLKLISDIVEDVVYFPRTIHVECYFVMFRIEESVILTSHSQSVTIINCRTGLAGVTILFYQDVSQLLTAVPMSPEVKFFSPPYQRKFRIKSRQTLTPPLSPQLHLHHSQHQSQGKVLSDLLQLLIWTELYWRVLFQVDSLISDLKSHVRIQDDVCVCLSEFTSKCSSAEDGVHSTFTIRKQLWYISLSIIW